MADDLKNACDRARHGQLMQGALPQPKAVLLGNVGKTAFEAATLFGFSGDMDRPPLTVRTRDEATEVPWHVRAPIALHFRRLDPAATGMRASRGLAASVHHWRTAMLFLSSVVLVTAMASGPPPATRDPVHNGMKIGAAVGAAAGILVGVTGCVYGNLLSPHPENCDNEVLIGALVGAAVGAVIGAGIDLLIDRSPFVDPVGGGRGAPRIVVRWRVRL